MKDRADKALVVLSGGQDSTTCLYWAIDRFGGDQVSSVTFDYGQRHRIELDCARKIAAQAGVANVCLPIDTFAALGGDALTDAAIAVSDEADTGTELPVTFVAGRNLIFLTFAAAYAYRHDIGHRWGMGPLMIGLVFLAVLVLIPLTIALFQWLWNITMPQVFNLNAITYWQALRLLLIAAFLFGTGQGWNGS